MKTEIEKRIENIEKQLQCMEVKIDKLLVICSKMNNHIEFVETTYDGLKLPLDMLKFGSEKILSYISHSNEDMMVEDHS